MDDLILFGLSADMPHYGHIQAIQTVKEKFPKHSIIVMPCSANPLGKINENGQPIYPTNGYIRWQILYNFYQKYDQDIIVSQYEVAINTPSKTIVTIEHLKHTSLTDIKNQMGYALPKSRLINPNNVSLVIGRDLVDELTKWDEWEDILKNATLIITNRAGYAESTVDSIKSSKLRKSIQKGLIDGSVIMIDVPQIEISSRKLKRMIQNGISDNELLKYIPSQILSYIRSHQSDFSVAYYQNSQAIEVYHIAIHALKSAINKFNDNRESLLSAYIADLDGIRAVNKWDADGYKLNGCRLKINLKLANPLLIQKIYNDWMKNDNREWFKNTKPDGEIISPASFKANFKLLGAYGENKTVDALMYVSYPTGELKILAIKRNDDCESLAIPGGFDETNVIDSCINELLEECFSKKMFADHSISSIYLDESETSSPLSIDFKQRLISIIENNSANLTSENLNYIINEVHVLSDTTLPSRCVLDLINLVFNFIKSNASKTIALQDISKLKCSIYKEFLPVQYERLEKFVIENGNVGPRELCYTDSRNTNLAWISTKTVQFHLKENDFLELLNECGLELSGGDDAKSASLVSIIDFCTGENRRHSFHSFLVMRGLAKLIEDRKIMLNADLMKCLEIKIKNTQQ
ncbi:MAG: hypothetical protein P1U74_08090 [Legionellaceae bacterium]|nr:hypothetical protein [Legionellaceae bacterium]